MLRFVALVAGSLFAFGTSLAIEPGRVFASESYAIAMHGAPALPADFNHMP
jgi:peptide/nickel transport system substrate-binding protein